MLQRIEPSAKVTCLDSPVAVAKFWCTLDDAYTCLYCVTSGVLPSSRGNNNLQMPHWGGLRSATTSADFIGDFGTGVGSAIVFRRRSWPFAFFFVRRAFFHSESLTFFSLWSSCRTKPRKFPGSGTGCAGRRRTA